MNPVPIPQRPFWHTLLLFTIIVNFAMFRATYFRLLELEANLLRSTWTIMMILCLFIMAGCVWLMRWIQNNRDIFIGRMEALGSSGATERVFGALLFIAIFIAIPFFKFTYQIGQFVKQPVYDPGLLLNFYNWMCWWLILLAALGLKLTFRTTWMGGFVSALILLGVGYEIYIRFGAVSNYPMSLGWSEGSRYYYASLFFSNRIYGETFPLSTLHPTRYLLQSFPFFFPSLGIWWHRFWQFLLWIGLTAGGAMAVTRRVFFDQEKWVRWLGTGWLFLFLLRVGLYYHLEVMIILPLLFIDTKKKWRSSIVVILASLWAGISRVNWFPVPAMLAIAIYLLEEPIESAAVKVSFKRYMEYFSTPLVWGIAGLASAFLMQWVYVFLSGNAQNADAFTSSFTSDLLWYRLWPNENFPLGVIPAILIISGPMLACIVIALRKRNAMHPIRWAFLVTMLLVLFAGSAIVSTKIGGGGDLHNMDAYAIMVSVIGLYFVGGRFQTEPGVDGFQVRPSPAFALAAVIPIVILIPMLGPYPKYNQARNENAHQELIRVVNEIGRQGPVLFISERQAEAFDPINVPLVYDYEVVTLMEMAMSGNQSYLDRFHNKLESHYYAAIISGRQFLIIKEEGAFAEENNVWNRQVAPYILCYYESNMTIEADVTRIEVYVPTRTSGECPLSGDE